MIEVAKSKISTVNARGCACERSFRRNLCSTLRGTGWPAVKYAVGCHILCGALFIFSFELRCVFYTALFIFRI